MYVHLYKHVYTYQSTYIYTYYNQPTPQGIAAKQKYLA